MTFETDPFENKIDLSLPGFREDNGKIFIPPTVRHVEKLLRNEQILLLDPLPIQGLETFLDVGVRLAYGPDSPAYRKERVSRALQRQDSLLIRADLLHSVIFHHRRDATRILVRGSIPLV